MNEILDLDGVTVARVLASPKEGTALLVLSAASGFTEQGCYFPAESIKIDTVEGIRTLYEVLGRALEVLAKPANPPLPSMPPAPGSLPLGGIRL